MQHNLYDESKQWRDAFIRVRQSKNTEKCTEHLSNILAHQSTCNFTEDDPENALATFNATSYIFGLLNQKAHQCIRPATQGVCKNRVGIEKVGATFYDCRAKKEGLGFAQIKRNLLCK